MKDGSEEKKMPLFWLHWLHAPSLVSIGQSKLKFQSGNQKLTPARRRLQHYNNPVFVENLGKKMSGIAHFTEYCPGWETRWQVKVPSQIFNLQNNPFLKSVPNFLITQYYRPKQFTVQQLTTLYLVVVIVLYVLVTSVSCSPRRGGRTPTSSKVLGRAHMSRGIKPTFSVITRFKSIMPDGS